MEEITYYWLLITEFASRNDQKGEGFPLNIGISKKLR